MYSVVLMMALTGSGEAVNHCGASNWSCSNTVVASCGAKHGHAKLFGCSCGTGHSLFGGHGCSNSCGSSHSLFRGHSCSNSCNGGHSLFRGHSCSNSCNGGHGLFRRHSHGCGAPVVCSGY